MPEENFDILKEFALKFVLRFEDEINESEPVKEGPESSLEATARNLSEFYEGVEGTVVQVANMFGFK